MFIAFVWPSKINSDKRAINLIPAHFIARVKKLHIFKPILVLMIFLYMIDCMKQKTRLPVSWRTNEGGGRGECHSKWYILLQSKINVLAITDVSIFALASFVNEIPFFSFRSGLCDISVAISAVCSPVDLKFCYL